MAHHHTPSHWFDGGHMDVVLVCGRWLGQGGVQRLCEPLGAVGLADTVFVHSERLVESVVDS